MFNLFRAAFCSELQFLVCLTPQIVFLDTKPFVISTDELFQVDAYF